MLPAISFVSAAILAYEVLLMRLLAIVQWHHFAYMVISVALLGYGASGTFLALSQDWMKRRFTAAFAVNALLFGATAVLGFALGQRVPFNALAVVWDVRQVLHLAVLYAVFVVPFFFGANCVGLAFITFGERIGRIYRYDLIGAGAGALGIVAVLHVLPPPDCLRVILGLALGAAGLACLGDGAGRKAAPAAVLFAAALLLPFAVPGSWTAPRLSEFKGLSGALRVPEARRVAEVSSPLGLLTVVESPAVPFRHVPGLSLNNRTEPPPQIGVFTDGDSLTVITAFDGRREPLAYLGQTTSALPYHLMEQPSVLILGAGGGADVLQAVYYGSARIDAVELNPQLVALVRRAHGGFAGGLYDREDVRVHVAEARSFVTGSAERWDLIQIPLLDSAAASAAGVQSLSESYVYTGEALGAYLARLRPGGMLAITRWLKLPPRDSLKLIATAALALERRGIGDLSSRLVLIRGLDTTTLLIKNGSFGAAEIEAVRSFAGERSFDLAYYPGIGPGEANRFNRLELPYFHQAVPELLGEGRREFLERYKFDLTPASDDRPYFFDFFRWRSLPEFLALRSAGGAGLLEWGYLILFATLVQALVLSLLFILLPLALRKKSGARHRARLRILAYFFALGLAFLFVEIAFIQRFIVFLGDPVYAVAILLGGFLFFAGLGSGLSRRAAARLRRGDGPFRVSPIGLCVLAIAATAVLYVLLLPPLLSWMIGWSEAAKVTASLVLVAPLAFLMGMPFPLGLSRVSDAAPDLVPWAWGVNGCASVISAVLAMMLAIHFGFTVVILLALGLYGAAALAFQRSLAD